MKWKEVRHYWQIRFSEKKMKNTINYVKKT